MLHLLLARRAEARKTLDNGLRLRFAPLDDTLAAVAKAVDAERHCCRFLRFTILVESDGGPITLELNGPPGTQAFVRTLFDA